MPTYVFPHSSRSITWTGGSGNYGAGPDGVLLIQAGSTPVTITATTPAWDAANGYHGALLHVPGNAESTQFAFDRRLSLTGMRTELPFSMGPGDSAVLVESQPAASMSGGTWTPTGYSSTPSRSVIKYMDAVVVVWWDPTDAATESLTPPVIGTGAVARFLRSIDIGGIGIPQAVFDFTRLPSVVDLSAIATTLGVNVTVFDTLKSNLETLFANFMGDLPSGWRTDTLTPGMQHPGYGTYLSGAVSQALVLLASTRYNTAQKTQLALSMGQAGLHLLGSMFDGRWMMANGGHGQGRKALVSFFGWLANIAEFAYLHEFFASTGQTWPGGDSPFREQCCYTDVQWFAGGASGSPWSAGWAYNSSSATQDGSQLANAPSTWGDPAVWPSWAAVMQAYLPPTVGSDIGTALFFTLVGQPGAWSSAGVRMVEQWMTTSAASTPAATAMAAIGLDFAATTPAWGEDYAVSPSVPGLCAEAWKAHYSTAFGDLGDSAPGAPGVDVLPAVYEVP